MHELGVAFEIARVVEESARDAGVSEIRAVVLEIGERSGVVPRYIEACFPAAVDGTILEGAELRIETTPGGGFSIREIVAR